MKAAGKKGFTLVEVIIVLVIAGIVAAIAVPGISGYMERTAQRECRLMIDGIFDELRSKAASRKYGSRAEVSVEIYGILDSFPLMGLDYPRSVYGADDGDLLYLGGESGEIKEEFALSPDKSTVSGEVYTAEWSFNAAGAVSLRVSCSKHEYAAQALIKPVYAGAIAINGITESPETGEIAAVRAAADIFFGGGFSSSGSYSYKVFTAGGVDYVFFFGDVPNKEMKEICQSVCGNSNNYVLCKGNTNRINNEKQREIFMQYLSEQSGVKILDIRKFEFFEDNTPKSLTFTYELPDGSESENTVIFWSESSETAES